MNIAAIIADDFSSATDCGVQFALTGVKTIAFMDIPTMNSVDAEVIAIDTDSRPLTPVKAYENVFKAACYVGKRGFNYIYKSIDSTLRGNLGSEIDAMMDALKLDLALICPAFPYYGRTTINGFHFLNGVPVADSFMAKDPTWPIRESDVSKLLSVQTKRSIACISLNELRKGVDHTIPLIKQLKKDGKQLVIFDAEKEEDLNQIAAITSSYPERHLTVGSTGLSRYLPHVWKTKEKESKKTFGLIPGKSILLVAGSASPVTHGQVEKFIQDPGTYSVELNTRSVLDDTWKFDENLYLDKIRNAINRGMDIAIYFDSYGKDSAGYDRENGTDNTEVAARLSKALGQFTAKIVNSSSVFALILTGGDTAKAVCKELNIQEIRLMQEVEAGIPLGCTTGNRELYIVTKAGAFGTENSLTNTRNILRGMKNGQEQ